MTTKREEELLKMLRLLTNHIFRLKRGAEAEGMWFGMGKTLDLPMDNEHQQGPEVNRLYELAELAREVIRNDN